MLPMDCIFSQSLPSVFLVFFLLLVKIKTHEYVTAEVLRIIIWLFLSITIWIYNQTADKIH